MWTELTAALTTADENEAIRAIGLSGAGEKFCAGDDINDIDNLGTHREALQYARHILEHSRTIEEIGTPAITKIDGKLSAWAVR